MKMYISVLEDCPNHMVPVVVAHAVLGMHLKFNEENFYKNWLENSFRKCVVKVNMKEFAKIKTLDNVHVAYESTVLNGEECCLVNIINDNVPNVLKFAKLWKPFD
jgi:peptidyl-tRNA hydrolase